MLALYKLVKVLPQSKFFTLGDSNVIHREEKGTKWRLIDKEIECKKIMKENQTTQNCFK